MTAHEPGAILFDARILQLPRAPEYMPHVWGCSGGLRSFSLLVPGLSIFRLCMFLAIRSQTHHLQPASLASRSLLSGLRVGETQGWSRNIRGRCIRRGIRRRAASLEPGPGFEPWELVRVASRSPLWCLRLARLKRNDWEDIRAGRATADNSLKCAPDFGPCRWCAAGIPRNTI